MVVYTHKQWQKIINLSQNYIKTMYSVNMFKKKNFTFLKATYGVSNHSGRRICTYRFIHTHMQYTPKHDCLQINFL